jgi:hypothetical protein
MFSSGVISSTPATQPKIVRMPILASQRSWCSSSPTFAPPGGDSPNGADT